MSPKGSNFVRPWSIVVAVLLSACGGASEAGDMPAEQNNTVTCADPGVARCDAELLGRWSIANASLWAFGLHQGGAATDVVMEFQDEGHVLLAGATPGAAADARCSSATWVASGNFVSFADVPTENRATDQHRTWLVVKIAVRVDSQTYAGCTDPSREGTRTSPVAFQTSDEAIPGWWTDGGQTPRVLNVVDEWHQDTSGNTLQGAWTRLADVAGAGT